jgi:non-heme chloroperoxidase
MGAGAQPCRKIRKGKTDTMAAAKSAYEMGDRMRLILWIAVLIICAAEAASAQGISGAWQGTLHAYKDLRTILRIEKADDGSWVANWSSIDQSPDWGTSIPASLVTVNGMSIKIAIDQIGGTYEGALSDDGTTIIGTWTQYNGPRPLVFAKTTPTTEWKDPSPHKVQFVTVDEDVNLEVLDWGGSGPPLVFLTGMGNTAHVFDKFAPKFIDKHHVISNTRRGFGASSKPPPIDNNYDADRLGDDVLAVLTALKLHRPVLAGHSLAGEELSSIGTRHPERVSGLVYLDAAQPYSFNDLIPEPKRTASVDKAAAPVPAPQNKISPIERSIMGGMKKYTGITPRFLAIVPVPHQCEPKCDTTFAKLDADLTAAKADALQANYPNAHVVRLPYANHYVYFSNEADVLREMNSFMDGVPGR